jgi:hypothetical protein
MSRGSIERRVLLVTKDLVFRGKLGAVAESVGWAVASGGVAPVVLIELREPTDLKSVERHVAAGARVFAFGSHVEPGLLRDARALGATAVPNSEIATTLQRELLDM